MKVSRKKKHLHWIKSWMSLPIASVMVKLWGYILMWCLVEEFTKHLTLDWHAFPVNIHACNNRSTRVNNLVVTLWDRLQGTSAFLLLLQKLNIFPLHFLNIKSSDSSPFSSNFATTFSFSICFLSFCVTPFFLLAQYIDHSLPNFTPVELWYLYFFFWITTTCIVPN